MKNGGFILLLFLNSIGYAQNIKPDIDFTIEIQKENPFSVIITANFKEQPDSLFVHPSCPNYDYPEGWSTFIQPVTKNLQKAESSSWVVKSGKKIIYEVDLSFIKEDWEVGNEQAGTFIDRSVFVVTRSLFLFSKNSNSYAIDFKLPTDYEISAPWESISPSSFTVATQGALINNTLVWGPHTSETITIGEFHLKFVALGYNENVNELINTTFSSVLDQYLTIFPSTPKVNYLITLFPYSQNDGEAYESSNAFTLKLEPSAQNRFIWANQFAHELFHNWNGRMINGPNRSERQWFSEGFTEYYANLTLVRSGIITEKEFYQLIEKTIGLYYYFRNKQFRDISLVQAGSKKSKYRFGVYNGGWCAAFVMDMMIRASNENKSLDDFMRHMFTNFGLKRNPYDLSNLIKESRVFLGEQNTFFDDYILGIETLPVEEYFDLLGLNLDYSTYEATAFLIEASKSANRTKWLGKQ